VFILYKFAGYGKKMKDLERDSLDLGTTRIKPLFRSIFFPTLFFERKKRKSLKFNDFRLN